MADDKRFAYLRHTWELFKHEPFALADLLPYALRALVEMGILAVLLVIDLVAPAPWGGLVAALLLMLYVVDQGLRRAERRHVQERLLAGDQRMPDANGKLSPYCQDCPDHEACSQGAPCWQVREVIQ